MGQRDTGTKIETAAFSDGLFFRPHARVCVIGISGQPDVIFFLPELRKPGILPEVLALDQCLGRCARPVTKSDDFRVGLESLVWWIWKQFSFLVKVRRCVLRKRAPRGGFHFYLPLFASLRKIEK